MQRWLREHARRYVATHRRSAFIRRMAQYCRSYLGWYDNRDYSPETNGEYRVLQALAAAKPRQLFDVGANVGEWTRKAIAIHPQACVHAFEIVPATFALLEAGAGGLAGVRLNPFGLSDVEASVHVHTVEGRTDLASITGFTHSLAGPVVRGRTLTGDAYVREHHVESIDLLKIDVEGAEARVLRGFERTFASGRIAAVQFEYGLSTVVGGALLADLYRFLEGHGFVVGKIYPDYVEFRPFRAADEDCSGPNYLAVRKERADLIELLG
jgi:FkbM family methyltransferase